MSNPAEQSLRMFYIFSTFSLFVYSSINCSVVEFSGGDLMKILIYENLVGDFFVTRSAVLLKKLISLTFSLMVVVTAFDIR